MVHVSFREVVCTMQRELTNRRNCLRLYPVRAWGGRSSTLPPMRLRQAPEGRSATAVDGSTSNLSTGRFVHGLGRAEGIACHCDRAAGRWPISRRTEGLRAWGADPALFLQCVGVTFQRDVRPQLWMVPHPTSSLGDSSTGTTSEGGTVQPASHPPSQL